MYKVKLNFFNPSKIADSGQAFRIHSIDDTHTEVVAYGKYLQIADLGNNEFAFSCNEVEFNSIWKNYFDLDRDYETIIKSVPLDDAFLNTSVEFGYGIRILKQDIFETIISYIISQRRSIPSITTCVDRFSELAGSKINLPDLEIPFVKPLKDVYYAFPTVEQASKVTSDDLNSIGAGYRTAYILAAIDDFMTEKLDSKSLTSLNDNDLFETLLGMYGVGIKVANCAMLFGFSRVGRFPIDVWIKRIEDRYYNGHFPAENYPESAGILQQFMFYYIRKGI